MNNPCTSPPHSPSFFYKEVYDDDEENSEDASEEGSSLEKESGLEKENDNKERFGSEEEGESTSYTPILPPIMTPQPSIARSVPADYVMVLQSFLTNIITRLSTVETKVRLMKGGVKLCVERNLGGQRRMMWARFDGFELRITQQIEGIQSPDLAGDELDWQTQEVAVGPGSSTPNDISSMSSNTAPPPEPPVSAQVTIGATIVEDVLKAIGSTTDESRARSKGPLADDG
ncbi:hypothetical protein FXO37_19387 [Capsicum annuum]|nr:hypothetical protein FXO37_19387 [Capsicum annuum]